MKKVVLGIVILIVFAWLAFPWCTCSVASGSASLTGAQLLFNAREVATGGGYYSDNPTMPEIIQMQVYLLLTILTGVGAYFVLRDSHSPLWFWIGAFLVSIISLAMLFMAFANIGTTSILIGSYIEFFAALALIITSIVGGIISLTKGRKGSPEAIPH